MVNYTLVRTRRKSLAVYVRRDSSVEVRAPLRLAKSTIERFVSSKAHWIRQKQEQVAAEKTAPVPELPPSEYAPGEFEQAARRLTGIWEQKLGVTADYVGLRAMSSRWGSCTAKTRRIRINTLLEHCPRECLEYVIVHELAHMRENNHSKRFWSMVADALPDYKARQKKLMSMSRLLVGNRTNRTHQPDVK